jgi:hypothetical protein
MILVHPESATHGRPGEDKSGKDIYGLNGDHTSIVKFANRRSEGYIKVRETMRSFCETAPDTIARRLGTADSTSAELCGDMVQSSSESGESSEST